MLTLIVLLCSTGMSPEDCQKHRYLERYISQPVSPDVCIEQIKALAELKPKSPAGYYLWGCVEAEVKANISSGDTLNLSIR